MSYDKKFIKGLNLKTVRTKYGEIIKAGLNLDEFTAYHKPNERGWINFDILKSKTGSYYAVVNDSKKESEDENSDSFDTEEVPF